MNRLKTNLIRIASCCVLLTLCSIQGFAQLTVSANNLEIKQVLQQIEAKSDYEFFYSDDLPDLDKKVAIQATNQPIESILNTIFANTNIVYRINQNSQIALSVNSASTGRFEDQRQDEKVLVTGIVIDEQNEPIIGAHVVVQSTKQGTATDVDGTFKLSVPVGAQLKISFMGYKSYTTTVRKETKLRVKLQSDGKELDAITIIGYGERSKKDLIGSVASIKGEEIKEIPSSSLENLLQGRMSGVEITNSSGAPGGGGAIISVRGYNSIIDQTALRMGDYGEPLYVIDGVPVQGFTSPITGTNTLSSIDPSTIESIEVLKDAASAAIYGSRAGRGVILITTKRGREGKATFSANVSQTWGFLPTSPEQTGGVEMRRYAMLALKNMRRPYNDPSSGLSAFPENRRDAFGTYSYGGVYDYFWDRALKGFYYNPERPESPIRALVQDSLNPYFNNSTNWYDYAFRVGTVLNANFQASGGGEKHNYLIGTGVYDEKGIAYGSDFTRVNFLTNLNVSPVKNFKVDTRFSLTYMSRHRGTSGNGRASAEKIERMPVDPLKASPFLPGGGAIEEELLKEINKQVEKNESFELRGSVVLDYQFMEGLNFRTSGSANIGIQALDLFRPRSLSALKLNSSKGEVGRTIKAMNENILSFKKQINYDHNIDAIAGFSIEKNRQNMIMALGRGGASDKIHYIYDKFPQLPPAELQTSLQVLQEAYTDLQESALISAFGRFAYNYRQKYLAEFTLRTDGSSVFGDKNKYATFPAVAAGWAFSDEPFMKRAWWLNHGKVRLSWGKSGEIYPDPYKAHGLLIPVGEFLGRPLIDVDRDDWGGMINRELKWIIHNQWDAGIDIDLLDYRLKLKLDYYHRLSTGMLNVTRLPRTIYIYDNKVQNASDVINEGIELEVIADIFKPKKQDGFSWRMRFNATHNRNRLKGTFDYRDIGLGYEIPLHMIGRPLYMIYTFVDGPIYAADDEVPFVFDTEGNKHRLYMAKREYPFAAGMKRIEDLNGDYKPEYVDQRYQGSSLPIVSGGIANEMRYKDFSLSFLFVYSLQRTMINYKKWSSLNPTGVIGGEPLLADIRKLKFWEKPGDEKIEGVLPMVSAWDATMAQFGGKMQSQVEKVSYLKLKTVTLGYDLPTTLAHKARVSGVRLFLTGENLFTLTNYSGPDPEVVPMLNVNGVTSGPGVDNYLNYPLARKFTLGLTVNF